MKQIFIPCLAMCTGMLLAQSSVGNMPPQTDSGITARTTSTNNSNTWTGLLVAMGCDNTLGSTSMAANTNSGVGSAMTGPALNGSSGSGMNGTSTDMTGSAATGATETMTTPNAQTTAPDMARATSPTQNDTYSSNADRDRNGAGSTAITNRNSSNMNAGEGTADRAADMGVNTPVATDQNFPKSTASAAHESSGTMNRATDYTAGMNRNTSDKGQSGWEQARKVASQLGPSCHISSTTSSFALRTPDGRLIPFDSASNARIADQLRDKVSGQSTKIFRV